MAAVAAFTHDHRAWFRLWLPLGEAAPSRDTYLRLVRRLDPETAVKAVLWLLDGTRLPGLRELVLALDGKVAHRSGDWAAGLHPLHLVSTYLVRGEIDPGPGTVWSQGQRVYGHPPPAVPLGPGGDRGHDQCQRLPDRHRAGGAHRTPWAPATLGALPHLKPASGYGNPAGPGPRSLGR